MQMFKRLFDFCTALIVLVVISPLFLLIALAIKLSSQGPVFFRQARVGKDGREFDVYKFRSMVVGAEKIGAGVFVEEEDPRITRIGKILRESSLDELPQLINVLKGEMSLVGPRPTLLYQVEKYNEQEKRRLLVKPGISGWAQVNGRNALTWPEKIELDLWYVDNWSFWLDIRILLRTLLIVIKREGLYGRSKGDRISGTPPGSKDLPM